MIDAHHHVWRQTDLPWLLGPERPRIFGPYAAIKRDYPMAEFLADVAEQGIEKSVYVQANWAPNWFADEVAWVQRVAEETGWPHAIVGFVDVTQRDIRPDLDRLKGFPLLRGIRHQLHWHKNPLYRFAPNADLCTDPFVQANIAHLADYDLSFDLQVFAPQMTGAASLAEACPDVTFVLQHAGMLEDLSKAGRAEWLTGMKRLAACPNVVVKLSGFGTFLHRNDPKHIAEMIASTVKLFGAERCLFGSNFPIEKIWTTYPDLIAAFREGAAGLSPKQQAAIFTDTAARIYRLQ
ncbi:MAG: amidohydrolase family protein [Pseudomonadota bacterium]